VPEYFYNDSLVVFTHNLLTLEKGSPETGRPFYIIRGQDQKHKDTKIGARKFAACSHGIFSSVGEKRAFGDNMQAPGVSGLLICGIGRTFNSQIKIIKSWKR
jgi:hypothetical protein